MKLACPSKISLFLLLWLLVGKSLVAPNTARHLASWKLYEQNQSIMGWKNQRVDKQRSWRDFHQYMGAPPMCTAEMTWLFVLSSSELPGFSSFPPISSFYFPYPFHSIINQPTWQWTQPSCAFDPLALLSLNWFHESLERRSLDRSNMPRICTAQSVL